jgi:hypothetical protein
VDVGTTADDTGELPDLVSVMNLWRQISSTRRSVLTATTPAPGGVRISRWDKCRPPGNSMSASRMSSHSSLYSGRSETTFHFCQGSLTLMAG